MAMLSRSPSFARSACFGGLFLLTLAAFSAPLTRLVRFSIAEEHYSHILVLPLVSACLLVVERRKIFSHLGTCWRGGLALIGAGALFWVLGRGRVASASENDQLCVTMLALVLVWLGSFVLCYGLRAARMALFPLLFLFLMVPIPDFLLDRIIFGLQAGSADVSHMVFELVGVPVLRTGFIFTLPGVTIEVAKECSGIRSSLALIIAGLLAGHLFLRSPWTRAALLLASLPLLIVKNGIRIVTLVLLSVYVDPGFLSGSLHHQGGTVFFLVALALLAPILRLLEKSERMWLGAHRSRSAIAPGSPHAST
jgi:exosortase